MDEPEIMDSLAVEIEEHKTQLAQKEEQLRIAVEAGKLMFDALDDWEHACISDMKEATEKLLKAWEHGKTLYGDTAIQRIAAQKGGE